MRAFLIGCAVAIIIAVVGYFVLDEFQKPADMAFKTDSVRLTPHGNG